ncbi:MAG TPA: PstC family ABC transporter permease [Phycisphaerae bacterium]|nr:PstC family ABC transporter permease [Phycisphaerae bacterium]HRR84842.1 PstC family ABC transporter permease [Phycisphaerae bacterium]
MGKPPVMSGEKDMRVMESVGEISGLRTMRRPSLLISRKAGLVRWIAGRLGQGLLLIVTCSSILIVLFIFYFIARDSIPFFRAQGWSGAREFFTSTAWYPTGTPAHFGALAIFYGSAMVTLGATLVAVPLGVAAAVCLSDVLPFWLRQWTKPVIELLAAIPSVAFGFFALVVFATQLQDNGGVILSTAWWLIATPILSLAVFVATEVMTAGIQTPSTRRIARGIVGALLVCLAGGLLWWVSTSLRALHVDSGCNALNVSIILGIMALPTVVSVSEDALQAVGRELREGSYALGATRAETMLRVVIPAAGSGICAAVILGIMRAVGETMVVWMASGNASRIPSPRYDFLQPIRTLTATIAGEMGETDQMTGAAHYSSLFLMGFCLLVISFLFNLISEAVVRRSVMGKGGKR